MKPFTLTPDISGNTVTLSPEWPTHIDHLLLAANVSRSYTIPTGTRIVIMTGTVAFWAKANAAAVIGSADKLDGTGSLASPTARGVNGLDTIGFISATEGCVVTIECYG